MAVGVNMGNLRALAFPPDPVIEAYKRDVDRTLIRENLKLTVEERFLQLTRLQEFAAALRRAARKASRPA